MHTHSHTSGDAVLLAAAVRNVSIRAALERPRVKFPFLWSLFAIFPSPFVLFGFLYPPPVGTNLPSPFISLRPDSLPLSLLVPSLFSSSQLP